MLQIERKLAAQERGGYTEPSQLWYAAAGQWLKRGSLFGLHLTGPTDRMWRQMAPG